MIIKFLPIYCPNNVGVKIVVVKDSSVKKNNGEKVNMICTMAIFTICL